MSVAGIAVLCAGERSVAQVKQAAKEILIAPGLALGSFILRECDNAVTAQQVCLLERPTCCQQAALSARCTCALGGGSQAAAACGGTGGDHISHTTSGWSSSATLYASSRAAAATCVTTCAMATTS